MKRKLFTKGLTLFLAMALLLSAVGCIFNLPFGDVRVTPEVPVVTAAPTAAPTATPAPTPSPDELFAEIDEEFFHYYMNDDLSRLLQFVTDPEAMGFDTEGMELTLGDLSKETGVVWIAKCKETLEALENLEYKKLSVANRFAYDTFKQTLRDEIGDEEFYGYYEPLGIYDGVHTDVPFEFIFFDFDDAEGVEEYFKLMQDVPRFFKQVLAYEQVRAELGLFMTKDALASVERSIKKIINVKPANNVMLNTFNEKTKWVFVPADKKIEMITRNEELVESCYMQAYRDLLAGLKELSPSCRKPTSLCENPNYKKYYENQIRILSGKDLSIINAINLLEKAKDIVYEEYAAASEGVDKMDFPEKFTVGEGTAQENLDYLKELTEGFLPKLPKHDVTIVEVERQLSDLFAPAAYALPGIDDWSENLILVNEPEKSSSLLLTMAHESYPGHLYQFNYQRALPDIPLMQQAMVSTTYAEAWSQFAEYQAAKRTELYPKEEVLVYQLISVYSTIVEAQASIEVNYMGYTAKRLKTAYGMGKDTHLFFSSEPFHNMEYAFGIANMFVLYDKMKEEQGDDFDEAAFLIAFLDLGPSHFNLIEKRLNESA